jgi:hypothetical protein
MRRKYQLPGSAQGAPLSGHPPAALHNETIVLGIGQTLPAFEVTGVKPGSMNHEENGVSAFETLTESLSR